ncbi:hypothetical protein ACLE2W_02110 [Pseudomonas shahriarae]|uniref:hypothetical protein n=1 Tax=Pseudomonas shahriarae TaxID=2745512 RepID=UPI0020766AEE|nr:hypothetical protein [Pseudomonas shahriarae]MCM8558914.1 hypothetical protein [Pseudomonas shahriarae]
MLSHDNGERSYNIMVYAANNKKLDPPKKPITSRNFTLNFEPFKTLKRFDEYDGVIVFKSTFESFSYSTGFYGGRTECHHDSTELNKRKKELQLLLAKGGFVCFLLDDVFIDRTDSGNYLNTDLTKFCLNEKSVHRENFRNSVSRIDIKFDEFRSFLNIFGVAHSYVQNHYQVCELTPIAVYESYTIGFHIDKNEYYLPSLLPANTPEKLDEYFTLLANSLVSSYNKLRVELPSWIKEFKFSEETLLLENRYELEAQLKANRESEDTLNKFKSILATTGDNLVLSVAEVFKVGFGISVDTKDDLREDLKLLDEKGRPFCLCEIKGTNKGIGREFVNQADSHRDRAGLPDEFPSVLIVNTHIKNARSISEKDQEIAIEQIRHSKKMNILMMRTIDLLFLLNLYKSNSISNDQLITLLTENSGWLKCNDKNYEIISE